MNHPTKIPRDWESVSDEEEAKMTLPVAPEFCVIADRAVVMKALGEAHGLGRKNPAHRLIGCRLRKA